MCLKTLFIPLQCTLYFKQATFNWFSFHFPDPVILASFCGKNIPKHSKCQTIVMLRGKKRGNTQNLKVCVAFVRKEGKFSPYKRKCLDWREIVFSEFAFIARLVCSVINTFVLFLIFVIYTFELFFVFVLWLILLFSICSVFNASNFEPFIHFGFEDKSQISSPPPEIKWWKSNRGRFFIEGLQNILKALVEI